MAPLTSIYKSGQIKPEALLQIFSEAIQAIVFKLSITTTTSTTTSTTTVATSSRARQNESGRGKVYHGAQ